MGQASEEKGTVIHRYKEWKRHGRKALLKPAMTKKGKWLRFIIFAILALAVLFIAFLGPVLAPYDPLRQIMEQAYRRQALNTVWYG